MICAVIKVIIMSFIIWYKEKWILVTEVEETKSCKIQMIPEDKRPHLKDMKPVIAIFLWGEMLTMQMAMQYKPQCTQERWACEYLYPNRQVKTDIKGKSDKNKVLGHSKIKRLK